MNNHLFPFRKEIYRHRFKSVAKNKQTKKKNPHSTRMGFEPTRAEHNGLAVHRLNHSATSSQKPTPSW